MESFNRIAYVFDPGTSIPGSTLLSRASTEREASRLWLRAVTKLGGPLGPVLGALLLASKSDLTIRHSPQGSRTVMVSTCPSTTPGNASHPCVPVAITTAVLRWDQRGDEALQDNNLVSRLLPWLLPSRPYIRAAWSSQMRQLKHQIGKLSSTSS